MISTFCSVLVIAVLKGTFLKLFVSGEDSGSKTQESKNGQIENNSNPNEFSAFRL